MKYYTRLKVYKSSNLTLDIENGIAYSYGWYQIAKRVNGQWYVNEYNYSNSTRKHVIKIKNQLMRLGIDFFTVESPRGLQAPMTSFSYYNDKIDNLNTLINKKGTRKEKNSERQQDILKIEQKKEVLKGLLHD